MRTLLCVLVLSGLVAAQGADPTDTMKVYTGGELTVFEERFVASPAARFVPAEIVTDSAIIRNKDGTLAELLRTDCGVYVKSGQLPETEATPFILGGGFSHLRVLLDGVPVSFPQLGGFSLTYQPIWSLGAVEVVPGAHSALYGTGGMAGAINLRTAIPAKEGAITNIQLAQGSNNLDWLAVRMDHHIFERVGVHVSGSRLSVEGEEPGEKSRSEDLAAKLFGALSSSWSVEAHLQSHAGWLDYLYGHRKDDVSIGAAHVNGSVAGVLLRATAQIERYKQKYQSDFGTFEHKADVVTEDLRAQWDVSSALRQLFFVQAKQHGLSSTSSGEHSVWWAAGGTQLAAEGERFSGMLSARVDRGITGDVAPSVGLGARIDTKGGFFAAASAGTGFRTPTPNDLWWQRTVDFIFYEPVVDSTGDTVDWAPATVYISQGNEELDCERSLTITLTGGREGKGFSARATGFFAKYRNLISWEPEYIFCESDADTVIYSPSNVSAAHVWGAKLDLKASPTGWLRLGASCTYTLAEDSSGAPLPERPELFATAFETFEKGFWEGELRLLLRLEETYTGKIHRSTGDVTPGFEVNLRASVRYLDFEVFVVGENLTDNRYELYDGRKNLGARWRFGVNWSFAD